MKLIARIVLLVLFLIYGNLEILLGQNCSQNNVTVTGFSVTDLNGQPFSSLSPFKLGDEVSGRLMINLANSNSGNAFSTVIFYDIFIGETRINGNTRLSNCLSNQAQPAFGTSIFVRNIVFRWGEPLSVRNILMRWSTNNSTACDSITADGSNAQCFSSPSGFQVALPVIPRINFSSATCNRTVNFTSDVIGGILPYTYEWNFGNLGTSNLANPTFTFPSVSSFPVSLTVTDAIGGTNTFSQLLVIPTITINIEAVPTKLGQNSGSITITASGGVGPYSLTWSSDPAGFSGSFSSFDTSHTIHNLGNGTFTITVSDSQGCSNSVEEYIDWASILSYSVDFNNLFFDTTNKRIQLNWVTSREFLPGNFFIERALDSNLIFETIGELPSQGFQESSTSYDFFDYHIPPIKGRIYYRIRYQESPNTFMVTDIRSVWVESNFGELGWIAYPNPISNEDLKLKAIGINVTEPVHIRLISSKGNSLDIESQNPIQEINLGNYVRQLPKGLVIIHIHQKGYSQSLKVWKK
jgi:hypothetical protein